jgi:chemotaxis protein methyltransferase CheR
VTPVPVLGVLERKLVRVNEGIWTRLPAGVRDSRPMIAYGRWWHEVVSRRADREMYLGTMFLRNRPALELMRRLAEKRPDGSSLRIAVVACSIGVEVYSILWTLRRARPDLTIVVDAVDISPEVLEVAREGVYGPGTFEMVNSEVFERLTADELREMFDWDGEQARVKPWLQDGINWELADVGDEGAVRRLGEHDLVVANNFLCHMDDESAERCMRNLAPLVRPGGYIFVSGVDLDVRTRVARELGWQPLAQFTLETHDGDPSVRGDWPWRWWGLEPLDRKRADWQMRYASAFRVGEEGAGDPGSGEKLPAGKA